MSTLDRRFLATPPADGSPAVITMSRRVPPGVPVGFDPDGSRPAITFRAEGPTYMDLFTVLQSLPEGPELAFIFLEGSLTEEQAEELNQLGVERLVDRAAELSSVIETPFRTFVCTVGATLREEGEERQVVVKLELTAPSIASGTAAMRKMLSPQSLTRIAMGLCSGS